MCEVAVVRRYTPNGNVGIIQLLTRKRAAVAVDTYMIFISALSLVFTFAM
jgi:hypothetical protein